MPGLAYLEVGAAQGCEEIVRDTEPSVVTESTGVSDIYLRLGARIGSTEISMIGVQPPLRADQVDDLVGSVELYDFRDFFRDFLIPAEPKEEQPYTEVDIERLNRRASEELLEVNPLSLARRMRDILSQDSKFHAHLDRKVRELEPTEYLFSPDD